MSPLLVRAAAAALVAVVAVGCSRGEPEAEPSTESASPTPTFEVHPVVGERVEAVYHVSSREILGNGQRAALDEAGAHQVSDAIAEWLDGHLDDLQYGGMGDLASVAHPELDVPTPAPTDTASASEGVTTTPSGSEASEPSEAPPALEPRIAAVTTDLTNPDNPVDTARYHLSVYGEDVLEWATARVEVTRADGSIASATFVFTIGENYALTLVMAGPEAEVPA